ncbi:MAG: DUF1934 domain-containing protein [Sporolactobacillus sp.]
MNAEKIAILFTSQSVSGNQPPQRAVHCDGRIAKGIDGTYLMFNDVIDGAGRVDYSIKFADRKAWIRRKGKWALDQPLDLDRLMQGSYATPFGTLTTEADARSIAMEWDSAAGKGWAKLVYSLAVQGEAAGVMDMHFSFARAADR